MKWLQKTDAERFAAAFRETRRATPSRAGRKRTKQEYLKTAGGFVKIQAYLSPLEDAEIRAVAKEEGMSLSEVIRTLIRVYRSVPVDGQE